MDVASYFGLQVEVPCSLTLQILPQRANRTITISAQSLLKIVL